MRSSKIVVKAQALLIRGASIYAGYRILHHEVYETDQAEIMLIALGLWLLGVPPALWFDAVRRASRTFDPDDKDEK